MEVWTYDDGIPPAFFFPEMTYNDVALNDIRPLCPINCAMITPSEASFV